MFECFNNFRIFVESNSDDKEYKQYLDNRCNNYINTVSWVWRKNNIIKDKKDIFASIPNDVNTSLECVSYNICNRYLKNAISEHNENHISIILSLINNVNTIILTELKNYLLIIDNVLNPSKKQQIKKLVFDALLKDVRFDGLIKICGEQCNEIKKFRESNRKNCNWDILCKLCEMFDITCQFMIDIEYLFKKLGFDYLTLICGTVCNRYRWICN